MKQDIFNKNFWKDLIQIYAKHQFLMSWKKLRLGFLFTDLSQHFGKYLVVSAVNLFDSWIRGDLK